jgi:hypothetical protein
MRARISTLSVPVEVDCSRPVQSLVRSGSLRVAPIPALEIRSAQNLSHGITISSRNLHLYFDPTMKYLEEETFYAPTRTYAHALTYPIVSSEDPSVNLRRHIQSGVVKGEKPGRAEAILENTAAEFVYGFGHRSGLIILQIVVQLPGAAVPMGCMFR